MNSTNLFNAQYCQKHRQNGLRYQVTHILINQKSKNPFLCRQCLNQFIKAGGDSKQAVVKGQFLKQYVVKSLEHYKNVKPSHKKIFGIKQKFLLQAIQTEFSEVEKAYKQIKILINFSFDTLAQPFPEQEIANLCHGKMSPQQVYKIRTKAKAVNNYKGLLKQENYTKLDQMITGLKQQLKIMTSYSISKSQQVRSMMRLFMKSVDEKPAPIIQEKAEKKSQMNFVKIQHIQEQQPKTYEESSRFSESHYQNSDIPKLFHRPLFQSKQKPTQNIEQRNKNKDQKDQKNRIKRSQRPAVPKQNIRNNQKIRQQRRNQRLIQQRPQKRQKLIEKEKKIKKSKLMKPRQTKRFNIIRKLIINGEGCFQIQVITKGLGEDISQVKIRSETQIMKNHPQMVQQFMKNQMCKKISQPSKQK